MKNKTDQQDYLIDFQFIDDPKPINDVRLYQIGKKFCNQNTYIPPHLHIEWYELTIILGGKGKIYTNSQTDYVEVSEGDIYLSFPADIHAIESDNSSPLKYSFISFILDGKSFKTKFKKITQDFYESEKRIFRDQNVSLLLEILLSEFLSPAYKQEAMLLYTLNQILIFTCRNFLHQSEKQTSVNISKNELSKIGNIPYMTLSDIINGKNDNPKSDTLIKLRKTLNISIDDLLLKDLEEESK